MSLALVLTLALIYTGGSVIPFRLRSFLCLIAIHVANDWSEKDVKALTMEAT